MSDKTPECGTVLLRRWKADNKATYVSMVRDFSVSKNCLESACKGGVPGIMVALLIEAGTKGAVPVQSWLFCPGIDRRIGNMNKAAVRGLMYYYRSEATQQQRHGWQAMQRVVQLAKERFGWRPISRIAWQKEVRPTRLYPIPPNCEESDP